MYPAVDVNVANLGGSGSRAGREIRHVHKYPPFPDSSVVLTREKADGTQGQSHSQTGVLTTTIRRITLWYLPNTTRSNVRPCRSCSQPALTSPRHGRGLSPNYACDPAPQPCRRTVHGTKTHHTVFDRAPCDASLVDIAMLAAIPILTGSQAGVQRVRLSRRRNVVRDSRTGAGVRLRCLSLTAAHETLAGSQKPARSNVQGGFLTLAPTG